jgi:carbamoyltransferase
VGSGRSPVVLGINGCQDTFHDASATLIADGRMLGSMEEERLNRIKHTRGVPWMAVRCLLEQHGMEIADVDAVGFYLDPWLMLRHYFLRTVRDGFPDSIGLFQAAPFYVNLLRSRELIRHALGLGPRVPVYYVRHHLCHASAAFFGSGFERAAVLVVDGSGERETTSFYRGDGTSLHPLSAAMSYPVSIGFLYEGIASHLGLGWIGGAGKMMGLAPFGRPTRLERLRKWVDMRPDGEIRIDMRKMSYYLNGPFFTASGLEDLGPGRSASEPLLEAHADLAASAQRLLEEVIVHVATCLRRRTGLDSLCYAGGVALNIDANTALLERAGFRNVYIMPAAYDGGTSIGAAYATYFRRRPGAPRPAPIERADLGSGFDDGAVQAAISATGLQSTRLDDAGLVDAVASRLARGAVVGWFRGRMEFGPRALGFRSILADPRQQRMADYVNLRIKGRETFRPFAPAVPLERADEFFEMKAPSPFMLYKFAVREAHRADLGAVMHVDGSSRVQTVTEAENGDFHRLLVSFGRITGVPVLLNTSFNLSGEPLVETPAQAVSSFLRSEMDVLVLGSHVIERPDARGFPAFEGAKRPPAGVIYVPPPREGTPSPEAEPRRFDLAPSRYEAWLSTSIEAKSALGFFTGYYRPWMLRLIAVAAWLANQADRGVIRSVRGRRHRPSTRGRPGGAA